MFYTVKVCFKILIIFQKNKDFSSNKINKNKNRHQNLEPRPRSQRQRRQVKFLQDEQIAEQEEKKKKKEVEKIARRNIQLFPGLFNSYILL